MDKKIDRKPKELGNDIFRSLTRRQMEGDVNCNNHNVDDSLKGKSCSNEYVRDHSSLLSLQPWIFRKEICHDDVNKTNVNGDLSSNCSHGLNNLTDASLAEPSPRSVNLGYVQWRGRSSLRSRRPHRYSVNPVTSVENCLIPQLYNENFEFDEYVLNSAQSSTAPVVRPLVITDGNSVISKSSFDTLSMSYKSRLPKEDVGIISGQMKTLVGVPPLPQLRSPNQKSREEIHRNSKFSDSPRTCKVRHLQDLPSRMLLFCLGINIGVIFTMISNRREIERVNNMLKNTENLVQDLQEELDMKDSLTVKELDNEPCVSQRLDDSSTSIEDSVDLFQTRVPESCATRETNENNQPPLSKTMESYELSRIEAELEAELERLELNMNASSLERRMSTLRELDPDLIADVVHGDLRADILDGEAQGGHKSDSTSTTEIHDVNYAVSPQELSLRLHEVIQYRLEERVKELESALRQSQKQLEFVKVDGILSNSQRAFSNSDSGSYSDSDSVPPLRLSLAGDALDAYDEAYKEFMLMADDEECINESELSFKTRVSWRFSGEFINGDDTDDDGGDEGKISIQHIVERTRQGSPL